MYCSHCGKKVGDTMLFCPFCGEAIVIPDQDDGSREAQQVDSAEIDAFEPLAVPAAEPAREPETTAEAVEETDAAAELEDWSRAREEKRADDVWARRDAPDESAFPDLTREDEARRWILSAPEAFCNTADARILSQVLNDYDRETTDFYRWHVEYSQAELAELIARRTGIDFGSIIDLVPVERGTSGRIVKLRVVGSKRTVTIGKELAIRYALSESALYSSAFVVERLDIDDANGCPARFRLHGAGWGHGVGLCQIGAAVMGEKGYDYRAILAHYFIDAEIKKIY